MPLEGVYNFLNSKKFKFISGLIIAINGYLIYCFGSDDQKRLLKTNLGKLGEFIISYSEWVVFISLLVGGILPILISWLQEKVEKQNLASSYSLVLLETIETVVEEKRKRFAYAVKDLINANSSSPTCTKVFNTITQPQKQIEYILEALELCFKKLYPNEYFKIALMGVENNSLKDWVYFLPYTAKPNTDINDLRNSESTISHALFSKRIVIIEDVQKELQKANNKKYIKGSTRENENWSQLCYPVKSISSNEVIFIICIGAKKANFFQNTSTSLASYEWLLNFFSSRLALEHSLAELKEKAH